MKNCLGMRTKRKVQFDVEVRMGRWGNRITSIIKMYDGGDWINMAQVMNEGQVRANTLSELPIQSAVFLGLLSN